MFTNPERFLNGLAVINPPQNAVKEGMGLDLYSADLIFKETVDQMGGIAALDSKKGYSSVVFAVAAYKALFHQLNAYPEKIVGLSIGENASLVQTGIVIPSVMQSILMEREKLTTSSQARRQGVMLAFRGISPDIANALLGLDNELNSFEVVNINGSDQGVVAGETDDYDGIKDKLKKFFKKHPVSPRQVSVTLLDMPSALHHAVIMAEPERSLQKYIEEFSLKSQLNDPAGLPRIYSPMLLKWLENVEDAYTTISRQLTSKVLFMKALAELQKEILHTIVTFDPKSITPRILKDNGIRGQIFNIHDHSSLIQTAQELRVIYHLSVE